MYFHIGNIMIPSYGFMIVAGVISANLLAIWLLKKYKLDINNFIILEAYTFLGAFLGAKVLYFIVSFSVIDWSRIFEIKYLNQLMQGGFVFYGGLIGGLLFFYLAGKIHQISSGQYIRNLIWLVPFVHSFGRIGCHLVGCCYGRPYGGRLAISYTQGPYAPLGIKLFPVQLVEAFFLMVIAFYILLLVLSRKLTYTVESYIISYSILRFLLEFYRNDTVRGRFLWFSTSQWISLFLFFGTILFLGYRRYKGYDFM